MKISRRIFVTSAIASAIGSERGAAQTSAKMPMVGVLAPGNPNLPPTSLAIRASIALREGLRDLGHVEGRTLRLEVRWEGAGDRNYEGQAKELVALGADVIVAGTTSSTIAARAATRTSPIVMAAMGGGDPVQLGFAESLARPGGNITGNSLLTYGLAGKRLELLKETVPAATRIVFLSHPDERAGRFADEHTSAARGFGIEVAIIEVSSRTEFAPAFAAAAQANMHALVMVQSATFAAHIAHLAELALKHRLPTMSGETGYAGVGGLMNYGPNIADTWRGAARFVDKILKGAKPGEIPIEQSTKFELAVNVATARMLGLTLPSAVLGRADEVIE